MLIDIVYTWVDHSNQEWLDKKNRVKKNMEVAANADDSVVHPYADSVARFDSSLEELKYSLRSLSKYFGPYINHLYLVTNNGSIPVYVDEHHPTITIVDYSKLLGTDSYSSVTIESVLHRIPGLSDYYLYFCDDFFLMQDLHPSDLIDSEGRLIWYQETNPLFKLGANNPILSSLFDYDGSVTKSQKYTSDTMNIPHPINQPGHNCRILQKSMVLEFESTYWNHIQTLRQEKFRSATTFCFLNAFCHYYLQRDRLILSSLKSTLILLHVDWWSFDMVNNLVIGSMFNLWSLYSSHNSSSFACICDVRTNSPIDLSLQQWLDQQFPPNEPSTWERRLLLASNDLLILEQPDAHNNHNNSLTFHPSSSTTLATYPSSSFSSFSTIFISTIHSLLVLLFIFLVHGPTVLFRASALLLNKLRSSEDTWD